MDSRRSSTASETEMSGPGLGLTAPPSKPVLLSPPTQESRQKVTTAYIVPKQDEFATIRTNVSQTVSLASEILKVAEDIPDVVEKYIDLIETIFPREKTLTLEYYDLLDELQDIQGAIASNLKKIRYIKNNFPKPKELSKNSVLIF